MAQYFKSLDITAISHYHFNGNMYILSNYITSMHISKEMFLHQTDYLVTNMFEIQIISMS